MTIINFMQIQNTINPLLWAKYELNKSVEGMKLWLIAINCHHKNFELSLRDMYPIIYSQHMLLFAKNTYSEEYY